MIDIMLKEYIYKKVLMNLIITTTFQKKIKIKIRSFSLKFNIICCC